MANPLDAYPAAFIRRLEEELGMQPPPAITTLEEFDALVPEPCKNQIPHPPPAPTLVMTPTPPPPPDLTDPVVFKAACKERRALCRARTVQHWNSPLYVELGLEVTNLDWYVSPNVEWACRIPGCKKFGRDFKHRSWLARHLKSNIHDHLGRDYQPPPVDLSTPYTFEFVAPPPVIHEPDLTTWEALWAKQDAWRARKEREQGTNSV